MEKMLSRNSLFAYYLLMRISLILMMLLIAMLSTSFAQQDTHKNYRSTIKQLPNLDSSNTIDELLTVIDQSFQQNYCDFVNQGVEIDALSYFCLLTKDGSDAMRDYKVDFSYHLQKNTCKPMRPGAKLCVVYIMVVNKFLHILDGNQHQIRLLITRSNFNT